MKKLKNYLTNTLNVNKSKFICELIPVKTVEDVKENLKNINKKYFDATHHCYAYILDDGMIQKCVDDGEPAKTAGAPILDVVKKNDVTNILAVVTRYFGGIKLGAGGLTRAYSQATSDTIKDAKFYETKTLNLYKIEVDYNTYNRLTEVLSSIHVVETNFLDTVTLKIATNDENVLGQIKNLALGKVNIINQGSYEIDVDI